MHRATSLAPSPFSRWMISYSYHVVLVPFVNLLSVAVHELLPGDRKEHHDIKIYIRRPDNYVALRENMFPFLSVSKRVFWASVFVLF